MEPHPGGDCERFESHDNYRAPSPVSEPGGQNTRGSGPPLWKGSVLYLGAGQRRLRFAEGLRCDALLLCGIVPMHRLATGEPPPLRLGRSLPCKVVLLFFSERRKNTYCELLRCMYDTYRYDMIQQPGTLVLCTYTRTTAVTVRSN